MFDTYNKNKKFNISDSECFNRQFSKWIKLTDKIYNEEKEEEEEISKNNYNDNKNDKEKILDIIKEYSNKSNVDLNKFGELIAPLMGKLKKDEIEQIKSSKEMKDFMKKHEVIINKIEKETDKSIEKEIKSSKNVGEIKETYIGKKEIKMNKKVFDITESFCSDSELNKYIHLVDKMYSDEQTLVEAPATIQATGTVQPTTTAPATATPATTQAPAAATTKPATQATGIAAQSTVPKQVTQTLANAMKNLITISKNTQDKAAQQEALALIQALQSSGYKVQ